MASRGSRRSTKWRAVQWRDRGKNGRSPLRPVHDCYRHVLNSPVARFVPHRQPEPGRPRCRQSTGPEPRGHRPVRRPGQHTRPLAIGLEPCMDGGRGARADRSGLAFGQLGPCIRRLNRSSPTARPDEFRGRIGPNQGRALQGAPVRTGWPLRFSHLLPSSRDAFAFLSGASSPAFVQAALATWSSVPEKRIDRPGHAIGQRDRCLLGFCALDDLPQPIITRFATAAGADLRHGTKVQQSPQISVAHLGDDERQPSWPLPSTKMAGGARRREGVARP